MQLNRNYLALSTLLFTSSVFSGTGISFQHPAVAEPIEAIVSDQGEIQLKRYPTTFTGTVILQTTFSANYSNELNNEACEKVATDIDKYLYYNLPPMLQKHIKSRIRERNSIELRAQIIPWYQASFYTAAKNAAIENGIIANAYILEQSLSLDNYRVVVNLKEGALSSKLADIDQLNQQINKIFSGILLKGADEVGQIHAMDLACDLANGKATLEVTLKGNEVQPDLKELLLTGYQLKNLYSYSHQLNLPYHPPLNTKAIADNKLLSSYAVGQGVAALSVNLDAQYSSLLISSLIDANTGLLMQPSIKLVEKGLSVDKEGLPYQGKATLTVKSQN